MGLQILVEYCILGIELAEFILCIRYFVNCHFKDRMIYKLFIITVVSCLLLTISILLGIPGFIIDYIDMILMIIAVIVLFQGKLLNKIFVYIIIYFALSILDILDKYFITGVTSITNEQIIRNRPFNLLIYLISFVIILFTIMLLKCMKKTFSTHLLNLHWSNYVLIVWTIISFTSLLTYLVFVKEDSSNIIYNFLIISFAGVTVGMVIIVVLMSRASFMRDKYKEMSKLNEDYLEAQKQYYVLLSEKNDDTRRFRHDIRNHLLCLQALAQDNKVADITEYIKSLSIDLQDISGGINSGSSVVDAILSDTMVKNPKVQIVVNGFLPSPLHISSVDLCTIFSNIITNAVEAVTILEHSINKEIIINIKLHENYIYINAINPILKKVLVENNAVVTTKRDKEMHGFGLSNIRMCVEKYKGTVEINSTENEFSIDIVMKNIVYDRLTFKNDR